MAQLNSSALAFSVVAALLTFAPAAFSADGTVLINQSTSINGLPGCAHAGFPITICQPGSYRLSGNLTIDEKTTAIVISANHVTLDLNGFAILGPNQCAFQHDQTIVCTYQNLGGIAIYGKGGGITVSNGQINGMGGYGVVLVPPLSLAGYESTIENLKISNSGINGIVAEDATVKACTISANFGYGVLITFGFLLNNYLKDNGDWGILGSNSVAGYEGNVLAGNLRNHGGNISQAFGVQDMGLNVQIATLH